MLRGEAQARGGGGSGSRGRSLRVARATRMKVPIGRGVIKATKTGTTPAGPKRERSAACPLLSAPRTKHSVEATVVLCIGHAWPAEPCGHAHSASRSATEPAMTATGTSAMVAIWQKSQTPAIGPMAPRSRSTDRSTYRQRWGVSNVACYVQGSQANDWAIRMFSQPWARPLD